MTRIMICRNCGGEIADDTRVCSFCETEVCPEGREEKDALTDMEKRMAEILMGTSCGGCSGCGAAETSRDEAKVPGVKEARWWKDGGGDCASCGGGLTGPDKDLKYALSIVGLIAGVIVFALAVKWLFGF